MEKLRGQLADASAPALQLLVELTWLYVVVSRCYKPETKRRFLTEIAGIGDATVPGGVFDEAFDAGGIAKTGTGYSTYRPHQLWLLIRFCRALLSMTTEPRPNGCSRIPGRSANSSSASRESPTRVNATR